MWDRCPVSLGYLTVSSCLSEFLSPLDDSDWYDEYEEADEEEEEEEEESTEDLLESTGSSVL